MNKIEYLEQYHQISQSLIGLVAIQKDIQGVKGVLDVWQPKLEELFRVYLTYTCRGAGINHKDLAEFMRWSEDK